jgi:hypothetical protein
MNFIIRVDIMNMYQNDDTQIIKFKSLRPWLNSKSKSVPSTTTDSIPQWYKEADRFAKNPINGEYYKATKEICPFSKEDNPNDFGKIPTWKACPAIMDGFSTGYIFKTPCDLTFFKNSRGSLDVKIDDVKYKDFCGKRGPMAQFHHPKGYYLEHFAWYVDWGIELPKGYSALFMTPMNRFDLPFINTTGVVDCDNVHMLGTFPFFIIDGWEGTIEAGTPFMQILPFKRENWQQEVVFQDQQTIYSDMMDNIKFYRQPDGGVYKNKVWSRREYK